VVAKKSIPDRAVDPAVDRIVEHAGERESGLGPKGGQTTVVKPKTPAGVAWRRLTLYVAPEEQALVERAMQGTWPKRSFSEVVRECIHACLGPKVEE
jgi:hypothetical protein